MMPRIIHQTWKSTEISTEWQAAHRSWRLHHPAWQHRLWTDTDNRDLVASHYPTLLGWYDSLPYAILKADVARVLILDHCGGVYADLDTECLRPLDPLLVNVSMLVGLEPTVHARRLGQRKLVSNAVLAATPGHPFLRRLIAAFEQFPAQIWTHRDVLEQTGPLLFSRIHAAYRGADVSVAAAEVFSPLPADEPRLSALRTRRDGFQDVQRDCIRRGAYAVHYWSNSWMGTLAGDLHNPNPNRVPGFRFYPGEDSPGHDIKNGGRDIPRLAAECLQNPTALGFNTDGFLKSRIRPRSDWRPMTGPLETTGLYVKEEVEVRRGSPGSGFTRRLRQSKRMLQAAWRSLR